MSRIVFDWPAVAGFVIREAALDLSPSCVNTVGVVKDSEVQGGVLYHSYTGIGGSVTIHMAGNGRHWASRDFLWAVFDYAFGQLFVTKVFGPVPSDNLHAIDVDLRLGFVVEAVLRGTYHDGDTLIFSMVRNQCKWLNYTPRTVVPHFGSLFNLLSPVGED